MKQNRMGLKTTNWKMVSLALILMVTGVLSACSSSSGTKSPSAAPANSAAAATPAAGSATPKTAPAQVIEISTITAWPENDDTTTGYKVFLQKVNEKSNGRIKITYRGGPESIPAFGQAEAVKNGVVDFAWGATSYFYEQFPEGAAYTYSEFTPQEERANGAYDLFNEIAHAKMNMHIMVRSPNPGPIFYSRKPINSINDFKGKRIRSAPAYIPVINSLGADLMTMPGGEIYSALDRGVIDGFAWPTIGATELGLHKKVKYKIMPEFTKSDCVGMFNLAKWNSFPDDIKAILNQAAIEAENELPAKFQALIDKENKVVQDAGVEVVKFGESDALLKKASDAGWKWILEKSPQYGTKLQEKFRKK